MTPILIFNGPMKDASDDAEGEPAGRRASAPFLSAGPLAIRRRLEFRVSIGSRPRRCPMGSPCRPGRADAGQGAGTSVIVTGMDARGVTAMPSSTIARFHPKGPRGALERLDDFPASILETAQPVQHGHLYMDDPQHGFLAGV